MGIAVAILWAFSPVAASAREDGVLLSSPDFDYLLTLGVLRDSPVLQKMSPKELYRLRRLISDERTINDPKARSESIRRLLTEFEGNQRWDKENPGKFWDVEKSRNSQKANPN